MVARAGDRMLRRILRMMTDQDMQALGDTRHQAQQARQYNKYADFISIMFHVQPSYRSNTGLPFEAAGVRVEIPQAGQPSEV